MLRYVLSLLVMVFPLASYAQEAAPAAPAPVVTAVEDSQKLESGEILRGNFKSEGLDRASGKEAKASGSFVISPDHGLLWKLEEPVSVTMVTTPTGIAQFSGSVVRLRASVKEQPSIKNASSIISGVMSGNWAALEKDFKVMRGGEEKNWIVRLLPKTANPDAAVEISSVTVRGGRFVHTISIMDKNKNPSSYTLTGQTISKTPLTKEELEKFKTATFK
ncbi:MAG: outer membrane lipoprotein carrier protein LolA [Alphaproteobacteria bacterium]|nr:outer membrane lipoprotein carrier protein LolA [Alphaproteobacteria bacterium]